ncbi:hypothetical protein F5Y11DRAFT_153663 [Daldinia sp. FL1419]|nr:hypothetical protein F5Y11DRAFT_153663 [Daldinia sp. FL1419]
MRKKEQKVSSSFLTHSSILYLACFYPVYPNPISNPLLLARQELLRLVPSASNSVGRNPVSQALVDAQSSLITRKPFKIWTIDACAVAIAAVVVIGSN